MLAGIECCSMCDERFLHSWRKLTLIRSGIIGPSAARFVFLHWRLAMVMAPTTRTDAAECRLYCHPGIPRTTSELPISRIRQYTTVAGAWSNLLREMRVIPSASARLNLAPKISVKGFRRGLWRWRPLHCRRLSYSTSSLLCLFKSIIAWYRASLRDLTLYLKWRKNLWTLSRLEYSGKGAT